MSGLHCQDGYIFFYLNRESYELNLSAFNSIVGFPSSMDFPYHHVAKNSTQMLFRMEFLGIIEMIQAIPKPLLLETLVFNWPIDYLHIFCLLTTIFWMCLGCLNYISFIACSKVTNLTPVYPWSISYIVRLLVWHRCLWLGASLPQLLGLLESNRNPMTEFPVPSHWT